MVKELAPREIPTRESVVDAISHSTDPIGTLRESADQGFLLPRHIAIIPDGNGRWAQRNRRRAVTEGHQKGTETIIDLVRQSKRLFPYVDTITLWALSPDNIKNRSSQEVTGLMHIINDAVIGVRDELMADNGRIIHLGDKAALPPYLQTTLSETETMTGNNTGPKIVLAVNYGGENQRLAVANDALAYSRDHSLSQIDSTTLQKIEDPYGVGRPDLIIRTGTETEDGQSLSGFGIDGPGTQLLFTPTLFPDFSRKELAEMITQYRPRRMGGRPEIQPDSEHIDGIEEVLHRPPFSTRNEKSAPIMVISDYDGVIGFASPLMRKKEDVEKRTRALREIAKLSDEFVWWSARGTYGDWRMWKLVQPLVDRRHPQKLSMYPFLSYASQDKLAAALTGANPDIRVSFQGGPHKQMPESRMANAVARRLPQSLGETRDAFIPTALSALQLGKQLVVIGSGPTERFRVQQLKQLATQQGIPLDGLQYHSTDTSYFTLKRRRQDPV